ncbi:hypothetical protein FF1_024729 [Malus domestica]
MGFVKAEGDWVFQNLREFNIALFAKQCWRLIHDPNSLWARVLKDRYFPNIMSGDQTRIWVDRWLPNIPIGHPIPILGIFNGCEPKCLLHYSTGFLWMAMGVH